MSTHTTTLVFLVVTILLLQSPFPNAKILTIPGDAPSIEEAIERAESGDIIQVNQAKVPFCKDAPCVNFDSETGCFMGNPVIIQNKDLTFIAPTRVELGMVWGPAINQLNSYSMLQINNSNVTFCNFYLPETLRTHVFWGSVIQVNSGTLTLQSCYWKCLIECSGNLIVDQCTIEGDSWYNGYAYSAYTLANPAIQINNAQNAHIEIIDSTITGLNPDGYRTVVMKNVNNSQVRFIRSNVYGGTFDTRGEVRPSTLDGGHGIEIYDSHGTNLVFEDSKIIGDKGTSSRYYRFSSYYPAGNGGNAVTIANSSLTIECVGLNLFQGGNGGNGIVANEPYPTSYDLVIQDAGDGGYGFYLSQASIHFSSEDVLNQAVGGKKGLGSSKGDSLAKDGVDGLPLFADANSSTSFLSTAAGWELY